MYVIFLNSYSYVYFLKYSTVGNLDCITGVYIFFIYFAPWEMGAKI